jgi:autotransporter translocation and assembly factor TamB
LRALVSGRSGRITGVKVGPDSLLVPRFSGDLEVIKARYTGTFAETPGAADPRLATVAPDWLADLRLHAAPRVGHIVNREMELDLSGDLDLIRTEEGLHMRGRLDVDRGSLIVFNNAFEVQRGALDFSQGLGLDPMLDIEAQTRYRLRSPGNTTIEVLGVQVGGSLAKPVVEFTSERGYSREAIQRMLLGLDPEGAGQPGADSARLAASSITAGLNLIEREIARELAMFDTFDIDQIQRENDQTGAMGFDPLIGVGKYIGQDLYLKYAQGVRQDDRDVLLEYQINHHLLLQSELRRRIDENQGDATYNLDLKYRFEY